MHDATFGKSPACPHLHDPQQRQPWRPDPDHRHRQQQRHDPHAKALENLRGRASGHQAQLGGPRRKRSAPAPDHRHRHPGRTVRRADHRHVRSRTLGCQGLAGADEGFAGWLCPRRRVCVRARRPVGQRPAVRPAVLRRKLDHLLPHRPVQGRRPEHARAPDLGTDQRIRQQTHPQR
ncbi:hypothetical protein D3C80_1336940 [compost metagenome]